jgi:hypothetical protein
MAGTSQRHAHMKSIRIALPLLFFAVACTTTAPPLPAEAGGRLRAPDVRGQITKHDGNEFLVEEKPGENSGAKMMVRVNGDTIIETTDGEARTASDLAVGQNVLVWTTGPVTQSYPNRGTAARVQLEHSGP